MHTSLVGGFLGLDQSKAAKQPDQGNAEQRTHVVLQNGVMTDVRPDSRTKIP